MNDFLLTACLFMILANTAKNEALTIFYSGLVLISFVFYVASLLNQ